MYVIIVYGVTNNIMDESSQKFSIRVQKLFEFICVNFV